MRRMTTEQFLSFLKQTMSRPSLYDDILDVEQGPFALTREFDVVLVGPCSSDGWTVGRRPSVEFPLGTYAIGESLLHSVMKDVVAKTALLISGCCGVYSDEHCQLIRDSHPEVEFTILDVPDFCDNLFQNRKDHVGNLIKSLRKQGLMR